MTRNEQIYLAARRLASDDVDRLARLDKLELDRRFEDSWGMPPNVGNAGWIRWVLELGVVRRKYAALLELGDRALDAVLTDVLRDVYEAEGGR